MNISSVLFIHYCEECNYVTAEVHLVACLFDKLKEID